MNQWVSVIVRLLVLVTGCAIISAASAADSSSQTRPSALPVLAEFVNQYCIDCHNHADATAGLALDTLSSTAVARHNESWEKVVRKLVARQMPPLDMPRPSEPEYDAMLSDLTASLDAAAAKHPNPGRTDTFRRLNRTQYRNAIRDLLALDIDATAWLPADPSSHGFDNVTVSDLSPTLLNSYVTAAERISQLAVGSARRAPGGDTIRLRPDLTQEQHVDGLPLGTRGGALIPYTFPQDGEYEIQLRLTRDRNEHVEGLREPHELEVLLDRQRMQLFTVNPPSTERDHQLADQHLQTRFRATAGPHQLGVTFLKNPSSVLETKRQPYQAHFNAHRHPRLSPAIYQISITGPYTAEGPGNDTPSRRRLFNCYPANPSEEEACAQHNLATLVRRAYRRPLTDADLQTPMEFFRKARTTSTFEAAMEMALSAVLVNPNFLFRIEQDRDGISPGAAYNLSDVQLASRLSFFLWSSIPDDELLDLAERGELSEPIVLEQQARRMLADERSRSLVTDFAGQWLHLRNLEAITPDLRLFPDFDDNLRQAFRQETELLCEYVLRQDRPVLELLKTDFTFLNERLAKHYGIPNVYGSRFRRVALDASVERGGLLRHGSILTVTSYATRTSPVIRGHWILKSILGSPPPPPPANVPALKDNTVSSNLTVRERLAEHRANPACASCHTLMDPIGFSLENFDAVGRWRVRDAGLPIDASGGLPDGSQFTGPDGLEKALLQRPEVFVGTLAEKLLTFALGRGVEPSDAPAIRKIVHDARAADYRFSALVAGIVASTPFRMRRAE